MLILNLRRSLGKIAEGLLMYEKFSIGLYWRYLSLHLMILVKILLLKILLPLLSALVQLKRMVSEKQATYQTMTMMNGDGKLILWRLINSKGYMSHHHQHSAPSCFFFFFVCHINVRCFLRAILCLSMFNRYTLGFIETGNTAWAKLNLGTDIPPT